MGLNREHARWIGFICVVIAGIGFEFSPWGERVARAVLDLQLLALNHWAPGPISGADVVSGAGAASNGPAIRGLSRAVAASLVVIGALVWWESRLPGWAIASGLTALAALLAVSTMMLPRAVLVPVAGPALAIIAGVLARRGLEAVIAFRERARRRPGSRR